MFLGFKTIDTGNENFSVLAIFNLDFFSKLNK